MNLGKISSFLSVGSALFAFFGMLKLYLFYRYFNIDILYFITFTDLLNASLEGLFIGFIFLPIMIITLSLIRKKNIEPTASLWKTFKKQPALWVFIIALYIVFIYSWGWHYKDLVFDNHTKFLVLLLFITPFLLIRGLNNIFYLMNWQPLKLLDKVMLLSFLIAGLLYISSAYKDINFLENGYHNTTNVHFKNNTVLMGSDSTYYIGNTSQYLFFYDESNGDYVTTAYPMSGIAKIEF